MLSQVLVVDDHPLFREGICRLLERDPRLSVVGEVGSAAEALSIARTRAVDLAIIDLVLPIGSGGGVTLTQRLKQAQPRCRVLGLSVHDDPTHVAAMLRAGADGFAFKTQMGAEILDAIQTVLGAKRYLPPAIDAGQVMRLATSREATPLERLTQREREVFELLVAGESNEGVAARLFIARRTVETHRQNIMKKLEVSSIAELVRLSFQLGA